jgi:hypothetical protein
VVLDGEEISRVVVCMQPTVGEVGSIEGGEGDAY